MVGDGPLKKELENYTKELKLTNKIIFTGFLGDKGKEKYILDSSIFILPSYTESFGLVLIEAMSYLGYLVLLLIHLMEQKNY